ncbi:hypothetical protein A1Q1_02664 [Trichosporon asahii var. asahii CBS 2479]|uniref:Uncharacterized protein n=1 Tax=Trichosporon asahii var. asahii (strain ATCC 90039 / CBS 2479 / JCM 2466 / KCTC 7840 / NBRC 103889/ NCYC 2677 / UAMH 7654) TaxID=1186058 RepID=J5SZM0_TRIAS|nr:hypothetical protein A1Q1_02664 [Trichosporon asahii var. asahii CBS 2479]EJT48381.1 hypothetical protein A1Q1_02664 [Trichosporon asahii var. asahii CBS 2479]
MDGSYKFPSLSSLDHAKEVLANAGVHISTELAGDFKSGTMNGDGLGDYVLINPSTPGERQIPPNSYYAILKGPRSERQSDCWVVWDPKPPAAEAVQHSFGYSPQNYTDAADMSAVALDPSQSYTMRIFSQGNRPWGCLFQKLVVYQTTDQHSPLPDVTETHAPTIDATGSANGTSTGKSSSSSSTGAIVGGLRRAAPRRPHSRVLLVAQSQAEAAHAGPHAEHLVRQRHDAPLRRARPAPVGQPHDGREPRDVPGLAEQLWRRGAPPVLPGHGAR